MTETEHPEVIQIFAPDTIAEQPFELDGVWFVPSWDRRFEHACDGERAHFGDVLFDDARFWFARKLVNGELSDWQPMRCVHEARAYLVSKRRL